MIFDADTHISPGGGSFALESHLEAMEKSGIDMSLCWLSPHHYSDAEGVAAGNRYVAEAMRSHPDRILGFGWADPTFGLEQAKRCATICVEELGLYGVKMNGAQNDYFIDDPVVGLPLAEHIASLGKAIAFHIGPDAYEKTHPLRAAVIARLFPQTPMLMVHMGMTHEDMNTAVIEAAKLCPSMYLVGSGTTYQAVLRAIRDLGADRVLFGTDSPFQKMKVIQRMYESALEDECTPEEIELVMSGNAKRLLMI